MKTLEDMGEEEFERHRSSLINLCQFKPASAREEAQRPWDTMQKGQYHFYRFEQDAQVPCRAPFNAQLVGSVRMLATGC